MQVIGNGNRIYDVDVGYPGSVHDLRIWKRSVAKRIVESDPDFFIAGDIIAYPISRYLMKPYPIHDAHHDSFK